jgi:hypothetical protein
LPKVEAVSHIRPLPFSERGLALTELLVASTISLLVTAAALTTFRNALIVNDSAAQMSDANQNLRAGTNQLVRDLMMAGRIIGPEGINVPTGTGVLAFNRPGPGTGLTFDLVVDADTTLNLPDITTGSELGPTINGSHTDVVTIMMVDEFMPAVQTPPATGTPTATEGTIDPAGASVTLPSSSYWLVGDTNGDTPAIQVGDLVFFKNANGNAIQTVTRKDSTHIYFDQSSSNDWFRFNQRGVTAVPILLMKLPLDTTSAWTLKTSLFRALMITYYIDNTTVPGTPRITRVVNHFAPQVLAGIVEDFDVTYDLVDGVTNPTNIRSLPYTDTSSGLTYNSNQIRKVNLHVGVRSEVLSQPAQDYIRNHLTTAVDVRSLASITRYPTQ